MSAKCINKNTCILLIHFPVSLLPVEQMVDFTEDLHRYCDDTVFPFVIADNVEKVEIEFINNETLSEKEREKLNTTIENLLIKNKNKE